jgi:tetratricopeptide (TPR) repeat protein
VFFSQAVEAARRRDLKNAVAELTADSGRWEAFFGNSKEACEHAKDALAGSRDWRILFRTAMTLARCGRTDEAQALVDEMSGRYPTHTYIQNVSLPIIRAFIELARGNPAEAIRLLGASRDRAWRVSLWPAYIAGEAYLRMGAGTEARAELQKIIDHRGIDPFSPVYPLAKLGLARALAASGQKEKGRKAYQDFFTLWKSADEDMPLFRLALSEYARLK